jgi:hypothetical protein
MACHIQQEIAEEVGVSQSEIDRQFTQNGNLADLGKSDQAASEHATDFEPPVYNIWKQQEKTAGQPL